MAQGGGVGPISSAGDIINGGLSLGAGIYGIFQAGNVRNQEEGILNRQKALFNNFEIPTMEKQNNMTYGNFVTQVAAGGQAVNSGAAQYGFAEESQSLSNQLNLTNQKQQLQFQSEQNQINNQYSSSLSQGIMSTIGGVAGIGTGVAGLA